MAKTETSVTNLKINQGTYADIQDNLSSIGEDELIITDDKNIPIPSSNDGGKFVGVDNSGEFALINAGIVGNAAPTTATAANFVGQIYIDTTNNNTYQCTAITGDGGNPEVFTYTWSLVLKDTNVSNLYGIGLDSGKLCTVGATDAEIDARTHVYHPITPAHLNYAVKAALSDANHLTMTAAEQAVAQSVLGISGGGVDIDDSSITENASNKIQAVGVISTNGLVSADEIDLGLTVQIYEAED